MLSRVGSGADSGEVFKYALDYRCDVGRSDPGTGTKPKSIWAAMNKLPVHEPREFHGAIVRTFDESGTFLWS